MPRLLRITLAVVMLVAPACGRYVRRSSSHGPATTGAGRVGDAMETFTTPQGTIATQPGRPVTTTKNARDPDLAANQSRYDSPEGFRLTLTVDGALHYRPGDDIKLEVKAQNVSTHDLQFDPNDLRNFAFRVPGTTTTVWTDGNCRQSRVPKAVETYAQTLHPNEESSFIDTYPGPADFANRDQCRVANGTYSVFGFVTWCPSGSTDSRGVCDPSRTRQVSSAGVRITIG